MLFVGAFKRCTVEPLIRDMLNSVSTLLELTAKVLCQLIHYKKSFPGSSPTNDRVYLPGVCDIRALLKTFPIMLFVGAFTVCRAEPLIMDTLNKGHSMKTSL